MKLVTSRTEMNQIVKMHKKNNQSIGFVPTMGFLHEGHLALVKNAREQNDRVIMSIFVNPLQFGPTEDFDTYPRDMKRDLTLAENAGVDYVFAPSVEEMYPNELGNQIKVIQRVNVLCGKKREGHFDGVVTVLSKLFHIVMPDRAYFGKKDAQQVAVVDGLVQDFFFPVELVPVETIREEDGLAKSSRNVNLTSSERKEAAQLYKSLMIAHEAIQNGETNPNRIVQLIKQNIEQNTSGKVDYVETYAYPTLQPLETIKGNVIIALAIQFSKARLIDNIIIDV